MTTVRISVEAPEGDVTVQIDQDTVTTRSLGAVGQDVMPGVLEVLDDAVRRARAAYTVDEEDSRG